MNSIRFLLLFILIPIFGLSQNPNIENESDINIKFIEHNVKESKLYLPFLIYTTYQLIL